MNQYKLDKERLQRYLPQLRGCAGLSAQALGSKVGLAKQAISFLENHPEKPLTKMQYISIRAVFDEEYYNNPDNINLRDCYDLVFSDADFYERNKDRIEYALYQAVEDTKIQKRKNRSEAKKQGALTAGTALAGATAATIAIGGVAAAAFPLIFPLIGGAAFASGVASGRKAKKKAEESVNKRPSLYIKHSKWIADAFEVTEDDNDS